MAMREMDYFNQRPDLDMKSFFETRGVRMSSSGSTPVTSAAPPPKDTAWVSEDQDVPDTPSDGQ